MEKSKHAYQSSVIDAFPNFLALQISYLQIGNEASGKTQMVRFLRSHFLKVMHLIKSHYIGILDAKYKRSELHVHIVKMPHFVKR